MAWTAMARTLTAAIKQEIATHYFYMWRNCIPLPIFSIDCFSVPPAYKKKKKAKIYIPYLIYVSLRLFVVTVALAL